MRTKRSVRILICLFILGISSIRAWYPEYTVLATDFRVRPDYLRPMQMHSTTVYSLGEAFHYLELAPADALFLFPTTQLEDGKKRFVYFEMGPKLIFEDARKGPMSIPAYYDEYYYSVDYYWTPYRELSHEGIQQPIFNLLYLQRLGKSPGALQTGFSLTFSFDETRFYQPYDHWGWWGYNAMGDALAEQDDQIAYDDYRLRQYGEDESLSYGYRINAFLSKALTKRFLLGMRIGLVNENVDGSYRDFDADDNSDYRYEYERMWDNDLKRDQSHTTQDIQVGASYTTPAERSIHLSAGITTGGLARDIAQKDTSFYWSLWENYDGGDTNRYRRKAGFNSSKSWDYDGGGSYLNFLIVKPEENATYRLAAHVEFQSADLTEAELSFRNSDYYSKYYYDSNDPRWWDSYSTMDIIREGTGSYDRSFYEVSLGADWLFLPNMHLIGGLYSSYLSLAQEAEEPFEGHKYTEESQRGSDYAPEEYLAEQSDNKKFAWERQEYRTIVAVPFGILLDYENKIELRAGLTRYFDRHLTKENYDVIVHEHRFEKWVDGVHTIETDTSYVEGFVFPDLKDFSDRFEFNSGIRFNVSPSSSIDLAFTGAFREDYSFILSGSFSW